MTPTVLFVHSNTELYGADYILLLVIEALRGDLRPIVALPGHGPLSERLSALGVETIITHDSILRRAHFTLRRLPRFAFEVVADARRLAAIIRTHNVQLVYSNTAAVITGALAARLTRVNHLYHVHEIIESPKWFGRAIARFVLSQSDVVIAVSEAVRTHLLRSTAARRATVAVIHNGLDPARFDDVEAVPEGRKELGAEPQHVLFGVIGRIHPWKGQRYFLEAAKRVAAVLPQARFAIIGGTFAGYEHLVDELRADVTRLGIEDRVQIRTHTSDVPRFMCALDVFVSPSTSPDPLPTVVLEAMCARRPVVATAHGGATEMVVDGVTGLLASPSDADDFARAMLELGKDAALRREMGAAGRERLRSSFSLERFSHDIRAMVLGHLPSTDHP